MSATGRKRTYQFGQSTLTLEFGDITTSTAPALVSSDDYYLSMGGGVSRAILRAGGQSIALEAAKAALRLLSGKLSSRPPASCLPAMCFMQ